MKKHSLLFFFMTNSLFVFSQQKTISQGYLEFKVKYQAESVFDMPPPPPPPPPPSSVGMDMPVETYSGPSAQEGYDISIWFKPGFEKVVNTVYGRSTYLFNAKNKTIIALREISGNQSGTIATYEEEEMVNNYLDSLHGRKKDRIVHTPVVKYFDSAKTIAGFNCRKALLISNMENAKPDTITIWYNPDFKLDSSFIFHTDKPEHTNRLSKLHLINGLPVSVSLNLTQRTKLEIFLIKLDADKNISDKEFVVSKNFVLKSLKEVNGLQ